MYEKKSRQEVIDELTLALIYLNRFQDREGSSFDEISWKNYSFDSIDRLDEKGLIFNPERSRGGSYKYAYMTEAGREKARAILSDLNIRDDEIHERFEFREIKKSEAEEAAEIEKVCFPPNEACSRS